MLMVPLYLAAIVFGLSFWAAEISDPDLGWHLLGGKWIAEHHALPPFDFINSFNTSWLDYHWLAQLGMHKIFLAGGFWGIRVAYGIAMAILFFAVTSIIAKCLTKPMLLLGALILVISAYFFTLVASPRPQLLAILLLAFVLRRMLDRPSSSDLPYVFSLEIVLSNVHVYWVFVPVLWFAYRTLPSFLRPRRLDLPLDLGNIVVLIAAGAVSPYGRRNFAVIWDYMHLQPVLRATVGEFQSGWNAGLYAMLLVFLVTAVVTARYRSMRGAARAGDYLIFAIGFVTTIFSGKFFGIFALFMLPAFSRSARALFVRTLPNIMRKDWVYGSLTAIGIFAIGSFEAVSNFPEQSDEQFLLRIGRKYPIQACAAIANLPISHSPSRILTHFNDGGWCRWALDAAAPGVDYRVTTDGRTQFVPNARLQQSFEVYEGAPNWREVLSNWHPDYAVTPFRSALSALLAENAGWDAVFEDSGFQVYQPRN